MSGPLENKDTFKCWSGIFPEYVAMNGKYLKQHFNLWLLFNPRNKIIVIVEVYEGPLENKDILKCWSCIFP